MTQEELSQVTRAWAGQLATSPRVRERVARVNSETNANYADLINETAGLKYHVLPEDVPIIQKWLKEMLGTDTPNPTANTQVTNVTHNPLI